MGCCVRFPGLVFVLSPNLSSQSASLFFSLGCCVRLPGLVFLLSPVLSSVCRLSLVSGLVSQLVPKQFSVGVLNAVLSVRVKHTS